MLGAKHIANPKANPYATRTDFCRIFEEHMDHLYLLSFLLTGNDSIAERCFVSGLNDSGRGNPVFKEWAQSWARRTIIKNAIRMIRPQPRENSDSSLSSNGAGLATAEPAEIAAIVDLPAFERFAFVMSVLERYSDQECSLLLACTRGEVIAARVRALQQIGKSAEIRRQLARIDSAEDGAQEHLRSAFSPEPTSHLATA